MVYRVGTLFSGIGVPDLACALLGMDVLFQVEIDEFCRKVLAKHAPKYWPNAAQFTDVRLVGSRDLPAVDILIGGFPCQDVSFAGSRKGMGEGTRSGLWSEFARIIAELQPRCVVIENVSGVLAPVKAKRRCFTREPATRSIRQAFRTRVIAPPPAFQVITELRRLGYVVSSGLISAADFGAQHKRERWWCVAYRYSDGRGATECQQSPPCDEQWECSSHGGERDNVIYASQSGSRNLANDSSIEQEWPIAIRDRAGKPETTTGNRSSVMGYPYSIGIQGQWPAWEQVLGTRHEARPFEGSSLESSGTSLAAQSRVGRDVYGTADRLDFVRPVSLPNEPQFDYEPPRVVGKGMANRAHRIKALGNAWDFRNAYGLMYWVKDFLDNTTP